MCTCPNYMVWNGKYTNDDKVKLDFQPHANYEKILKANIPFVEVPCGKCLECRIQYARAWADRCVLEAKKYKDNYFVTLTYDDAHLPPLGSLRPKDLQNFMKRLRKHFTDTQIRFFACGEYGGESLRPHYHVILFNCPLNDLSYVFQLEEDGRLQNHLRVGNNSGLQFSLTIYDLWQRQGMISVAPFSYDTAAYVSQYVTKKVGGKYEPKLKMLGLVPEFLRMSNRPGIGADEYDDDLFDAGHIIVPSRDGHISAIPRYYDKLFIKKYGDDVFTSHVRYKRLKKKFQNLTDYQHSNVFKDRQNELKDERIKGRQRIRNQI